MFRVRWEHSALMELAVIWNQADSALRQQITQTTHRIDQALRADPGNQGESRAKGLRILFALPLGLTFDVDSQNAVVNVLHVWHVRRRS